MPLWSGRDSANPRSHDIPKERLHRCMADEESITHTIRSLLSHTSVTDPSAIKTVQGCWPTALVGPLRELW